MTNLFSIKKWNFEGQILTLVTLAFVSVLLGAWVYALDMQNALNAEKPVSRADAKALVQVEKIRNAAESQLSNSLSFFLMGSTTLFDAQKKDKQEVLDLLSQFSKDHSLPQIPEHLKKIELAFQTQQEVFDQGMEFRAKQTESKIIGQFYRSKTVPVREQVNSALNEIVKLHQDEYEKNLAADESAALAAKTRIPDAMTWLTALLAILFLVMGILVIRMILQRTRQQAERQRLYGEAQKAVLTRDEALSAISQDLKEPLETIKLAAQGIYGAEMPELVSEGADIIKSAALKIEGLAEDIIDHSNSTSGELILRLEQLSVDSILQDAKVMLQPYAKKQDIKLEFNETNPPVLAFMDRSRVLRVLSNLVGNAIKFSPKNSKVVVKVRSDLQFAYISVKDSGPGLSEKNRAGIFDEFWQSTKTAELGSGIGLAIVKTVVEAHGGQVTVESQLGHGSTFTFSLPKRRPAGLTSGKVTVPATSSFSRA